MSSVLQLPLNCLFEPVEYSPCGVDRESAFPSCHSHSIAKIKTCPGIKVGCLNKSLSRISIDPYVHRVNRVNALAVFGVVQQSEVWVGDEVQLCRTRDIRAAEIQCVSPQSLSLASSAGRKNENPPNWHFNATITSSPKQFFLCLQC